ncbi:MAG: hypothetical protein ABI222_08900 [Opitutaceae bacterium]
MKPFLQGKKSSAMPALRLPSAHAVAHIRKSAADGQEHADTHGQPVVEIVKEGDKVARLIVTCSCGQKIEVDCIYPAGT